MTKNEAPEALKEFLIEKKIGEAEYTPKLKFIFKHLIAQFLGLDYYDGNPKSLKKGAAAYSALADKINDEIDIAGFVKGSYLANLCFPSENIPPKEIYRLTVIFKFFERQFENNEKTVNYWIDKLKTDSEFYIQYEETRLDILFAGALKIDGIFLDTISLKKSFFKPLDFYLGKKKDDCQWVGIVNYWDAPREHLDNIKTNTLDTFKIPAESNIILILLGSYGSGISTYLRRISIDLIAAGVVTLWINDIEEFLKSGVIKCRQHENIRFLIIIDNWEKTKSNDNNINVSFFSFCREVHNIRIIISDTDLGSNEKEYLNFADETLSHKLSSAENSEIIKKVLKINLHWKKDIDITNADYYLYTPIYLIIFGLAVANEISEDRIEVERMMFNYKAVIKNDLYDISKKHYKGLSEALFYLAKLYNEYKIAFSWEAFLKLADHYNGNNFISTRLSKFNEAHPICSSLSHYFTLQVLWYHDAVYKRAIIFHADLLVEHGLLQSIYSDWYFDENIKIEILNYLIEQQEFKDAASLFDAYISDGNVFKTQNEKETYYNKLQEIRSFHQSVVLNDKLLSFFETVFKQFPFTDNPDLYEYRAIKFYDFDGDEGMIVKVCKAIEETSMERYSEPNIKLPQIIFDPSINLPIEVSFDPYVAWGCDGHFSIVPDEILYKIFLTFLELNPTVQILKSRMNTVYNETFKK